MIVVVLVLSLRWRAEKKGVGVCVFFSMLGVLVFGFCGFLSFCVGVCGFLRRLIDCGCFGFVFVLVRRERRCGCLRVFLLGVGLR